MTTIENNIVDYTSLFFFHEYSISSVALQSGQLAPVLMQFNFPNDVLQAANQGNVQAFAQALEKHNKTSSNQAKSSDTTMDTD
jgi:hypothetical protein